MCVNLAYLNWGYYIKMGKSKEEAYERFEKFIDAMSDMEFSYWYDEEATQAQQDFADKIRESVSPEEAEAWLSAP